MKIQIHQEVFEKNKGAMRLFFGKKGVETFFEKNEGVKIFFRLMKGGVDLFLDNFFLYNDRYLRERTKFTGTLLETHFFTYSNVNRTRSTYLAMGFFIYPFPHPSKLVSKMSLPEFKKSYLSHLHF